MINRFAEWLINLPFMEMAYYRKTASDKIRSLSGTVLIHIIKVLCLSDRRDINHWKKEINDYFLKIEAISIKPNNKKFTANEYYNLLFIEPYCEWGSNWNSYAINSRYIKMILRRINSQYQSNIKEEDLDWDKISGLFKAISEKISNYESTDNIINDL